MGGEEGACLSRKKEKGQADLSLQKLKNFGSHYVLLKFVYNAPLLK